MAHAMVVQEGVIRTSQIAELDAFRPREGRVSSYYLDMNPLRQGGPDVLRIAVKNVLAQQAERIDRPDVPHAVRQALHRDLELVKEAAREAAGERFTRGLACFVASAADFSRALRLPWRIRNRAFLEDRFVLWPLRQLLGQADRFGIILTDKESARLFLFFLERIEEVGSLHDTVPGRIRYPDPLRQVHLMHKHVEHFHHHFERVAEEALRQFEQEPFQHLIVGGRWETLPQFEDHLHHYLRDRVVARWEIDVRTPMPDVRERAAQEEQKVLQRQAEDIWKNLQDRRAQRGALGLEETLATLWQRRAQALLEEPGVSRPGFRCTVCGRLQVIGGACVECGGTKTEIPDVYEEAVHEAIDQDALVRFWKDLGLHKVDAIAAFKRF